MKEKVTFNMATMVPRIPALADSIPTILHQCDVLNVYLNNFDDSESRLFLSIQKIKLWRSQDEIETLAMWKVLPMPYLD